MLFSPEDEGVEERANDDGYGEGYVPAVADIAVDSIGMFEGEIDNGNEYDVETDDDEGTNGEIGDNV